LIQINDFFSDGASAVTKARQGAAPRVGAFGLFEGVFIAARRRGAARSQSPGQNKTL